MALRFLFFQLQSLPLLIMEKKEWNKYEYKYTRVDFVLVRAQNIGVFFRPLN